ncbi:MAG: hypothetical protein IIU35_06390 [Neisseriaceae bacterium]|nr:hypothetical protein [Neisseriaceae bacterium]
MIFALLCLWNFVSGCLNDKQQRQILSLRALPKAMRTQSYDYGKCTYPKNGNAKSIVGWDNTTHQNLRFA